MKKEYGGGYTLALYQTFEDTMKDEFRVYWTLFNRTGKAVIEKTQEGFIFLTQYPIGMDNGYIYFGDVLYKVPADAAKPVTPGSGPILTAQETIRLSGSNRFETAVAISKNGWASSENVVLAYSKQ